MKEQSIIDIAVKNIIYVNSDAPIKTAIDTITEKKIRNLVVYDSLKESYTVLSVGDLVSIAVDSADLNKPVSSLNLRPLVTCSKNTNILKAVMLFGDDNAIVGVVGDDGSLAAIATYSNVLNAIYGYEDDSFAQPIKSLLAKESILIAYIGDNLSEHLDMLNSSSADCLIVLKDDLPYGIITKRDIVKMLAKNISLSQKVESLMSYPLMTVDSALSINNALMYMQDNKLKRVIVVDSEGKLEGVITQKDILDAIYARLTQKGFFNLNKINALLQEQVNLKTMELQQLNKDLEIRIQNATEELRESERKLAEMRRNEAIIELLKNISHHWRQPLNIISILAQESEMILSHNGDIKSVEQNLKSIVSEVKILSSSIDKIGYIYKNDYPVEKGKKVNFREAVEYVLGMLSREFKIPTEITYNIEELELGVQNSTLYFILKEFVGNSISVASRNNKKKLSLVFTLKKDEQEIVISIQDDAGGIDEKNLDFIFDPYFTTEFKSRDKGLGLYLVKSLVEKNLNGKIAVKLFEGGVGFEIRLPLQKETT